jgi:hypothetical protein
MRLQQQDYITAEKI